MPTSVASLTTAYNAARALPRQIGALSRQTRPLDEIIVVDNASTDDTASLITECYPQVTVLRLAENTGAAGGWAKGLAYAALERKHDWIWIFDDDSLPDHDALEKLMQVAGAPTDADGEIGMIAVVPIHRETGIIYFPQLWRDGYRRASSEMQQRPVWFADLAIGSGLMVRRELVERIGLPRADFFMDFFDFEYCLRARAHGFKIAVATGVQLEHEVGRARHVQLPGFNALWPNHAPWREYYMSRNLAYVVWWLYPSYAAKWFSIRHMVRHAAGALLFSSEKLVSLKRMVQGFLDGRRARLGVRFRPETEQET
jgi:GT2 family glycosyltransferase